MEPVNDQKVTNTFFNRTTEFDWVAVLHNFDLYSHRYLGSLVVMLILVPGVKSCNTLLYTESDIVCVNML